MIRAATIRSPTMGRAVNVARRNFAGGPLEADSGGLATHVYHTMTLGLAGLAPVYFLIPDSYSDGFIDKTFGLVLSATVTAHSWIGLNYVATDYVPKVSKKLLGPARVVNAGIAFVTFVGLTRMSFSSPGGIKGCVKGLWNPPKKE